MAIALVAHATVAGLNGGTTGAVNTTGANFIALSVADYYPGSAPTVSDSFGNTYTSLTVYGLVGYGQQIYYCQTPTVGSGHTFTIASTGGNSVLSALAFSGMATSSVFQTGTDNGTGYNGTATTTIQTGSITPSGSTLIISGLTMGSVGTASINTGFTITDQTNASVGSNLGNAAAYLIQTSGSTVNPTWTSSGNQTIWTAVIAAFKGAASATTLRLLPLTGVGQ